MITNINNNDAVNSQTNDNNVSFKPNDYVVYPKHGVGKVLSIEKSEIAGYLIESVAISFEHEKMIVRVPTYNIKTSGMRHLVNHDILNEALNVLKGRARIRRTMWSRRAQEYENKINSGDLIALSEVIRDLHKGTENAEQSYSERQLYEIACERLAREIAALNSLTKDEALSLIKEFLAKKIATAA